MVRRCSFDLTSKIHTKHSWSTASTLITPKSFLVSNLLLKFSIHSSQTSWKTIFLETMKHNSSNDCSDTDFILKAFHSAPSYCFSLALYPAPFHQSSICLFTSPTFMISFIGKVPRQPYMSSAVSSSAAAAVGPEAKLTTHNGYSKHQTFTVKGWSQHRYWEVPVEVFSKCNNHQQCTYTACSNLHGQTDKNLQIYLVKPQPSSS